MCNIIKAFVSNHLNLTLVSLILLALVLIFFRFSDNDPSDGKYTPPQFKDGKIISPKTR